ncbi:MAG: tetratricopeptide repeat protein [Bacteroidia bacterium]
MTPSYNFLNHFFSDIRKQYFAIIVLTLIVYSNTFNHRFALDDEIVIIQNEYVKNGIGGVGNILSGASYESHFLEQGIDSKIDGARYRPLSIVSFAIEHELFGENWSIKHFNNVLIFIISICVLLTLLHSFLLKDNSAVAFIAVILFVAHPIHSEVVANVKSRDEIFSLLFICLTIIHFFKWQEGHKRSFYISLVFFFLSLLSKEYAVFLMVLLPCVSWIYHSKKLSEAFYISIPYAIVFGLFFFISINAVGIPTIDENSPLNNPYIYASTLEKWATKFYVLFKYVTLLIYPHPLTSDYSFYQISYKNFTDIVVLVSLVIYLGLASLTIYYFLKKKKLAIYLLLYLLPLLMISNLIIETGVTMGERLIYHSSLGFCILLSVFLVKYVKNKSALMVVTTVLICLFSLKTFSRNKDWKNNTTLFLADVKHSPNSVMVNGNVARAFIDSAATYADFNSPYKKPLLDSAIRYLNKSISIYPNYAKGYYNLVVAYYHLKDPENMEKSLNELTRISSTYSGINELKTSLHAAYYFRAMGFGSQGNLYDAERFLRKALFYNPNNTDYLYRLGISLAMQNKKNEAVDVWRKILELNPNHQQAQQAINNALLQIEQ